MTDKTRASLEAMYREMRFGKPTLPHPCSRAAGFVQPSLMIARRPTTATQEEIAAGWDSVFGKEAK